MTATHESASWYHDQLGTYSSLEQTMIDSHNIRHRIHNPTAGPISLIEDISYTLGMQSCHDQYQTSLGLCSFVLTTVYGRAPSGGCSIYIYISISPSSSGSQEVVKLLELNPSCASADQHIPGFLQALACHRELLSGWRWSGPAQGRWRSCWVSSCFGHSRQAQPLRPAYPSFVAEPYFRSCGSRWDHCSLLQTGLRHESFWVAASGTATELRRCSHRRARQTMTCLDNSGYSSIQNQ